MPPLLLVLALALTSPGVRAAEGEPSPETANPADTGPDVPREDPGGGGGDQGAAHLTIEDVRINFPTVVQAFVDKRADAEGLWPLRDKDNGKLRKLKLLSLDAQKAKSDGDGLYSAPAVLADMANNGERLRVVFTCSFQGSEWRVEKLRFVKPKAKPAKKAKKAA